MFELPLFYYGKDILNFLGPPIMMAIALISFVIRMFGYVANEIYTELHFTFRAIARIDFWLNVDRQCEYCK